jgi:quinol monooxygenase YgiN
MRTDGNFAMRMLLQIAALLTLAHGVLSVGAHGPDALAAVSVMKAHAVLFGGFNRVTWAVAAAPLVPATGLSGRGDSLRAPQGDTRMLFIFARFHVRVDAREAMADLLRRQIAFVPTEPGCLEMGAYRSTRDPSLFIIHSRWRDEDAFNVHAIHPNTDAFLAQAEAMVDQAIEISRTLPVCGARLDKAWA